MYQRKIPVLHRLFLLLQLLLQLRQTAILQLRCLLQVIVLLGGLDLLVQALDLLTDLLQLLHRVFLIVPACFLRVKRIPQLSQLLLQICQTLLAQFIRFFFQCSLLNLQLHDLSAHLIQLCRHGIQLCLDQGTRLIHQVDGLIRQEPVGNIPMGKGCRSHQGRIGDLYSMEYLIALFQATKDGNGILHCRLIHHHRLETTFQSRILFNILPVLIQRGGTDTVQLASCQHGLQHVARIHGAVGLACAHDGVQLIDKQNDLSVAVLHFLQHRFQAFLKLAPVFGACHQRTHIQCK